MDRRALGRIGEEAAAAALAARGYRILRRNVRSPRGEIDLIATCGDEIVFIEVKTRTTDERGGPLDAVHPAKQRRLARLARAFLHRHRLGDRLCRFDVVAVRVGAGGVIVQVEILPDAFQG